MDIVNYIIEYFQLLTPNLSQGRAIAIAFMIVFVAGFAVGTFLTVVSCSLELGRAPFSEYLEEWLLHMKVAVYIIIAWFFLLSIYAFILGKLQ